MAKKRRIPPKTVPSLEQITGHHPTLPGVIVRVTMLTLDTCQIERSPYRNTSFSSYDGSLIETSQTFAPITEPVDLHRQLIAQVKENPAQWPA